MINYKIIILLLFIVPFFLSNGIKPKQRLPENVLKNWSGIVTWTKTSKSKGKRKWDDHGKENVYRWDFFFEFKIIVNFINGKGTVVRADKTTNWEKDSIIFIHPEDKYMIEQRSKGIFCNGSEVMDLSVEFSDDHKYYWVSFFTPDCQENMIYEVINNIHGNTFHQSANEHQGIQITVPANFTGQLVGAKANVLSGRWEEIIPAPNDPGGGEIITRATWDLRLNCPPWNNQMTEKNIETLDSRVRAAATRFIKRVNDELCIRLKVTSAFRTVAEQDSLYAQGRTRPGPIVTNARGGQSNHNSASAIDVYIVLEDGSIDVGGEPPPEVIKIAKEEGFEWGGDWKGNLRDGPHFQMKLQ